MLWQSHDVQTKKQQEEDIEDVEEDVEEEEDVEKEREKEKDDDDDDDGDKEEQEKEQNNLVASVVLAVTTIAAKRKFETTETLKGHTRLGSQNIKRQQRDLYSLFRELGRELGSATFSRITKWNSNVFLAIV